MQEIIIWSVIIFIGRMVDVGLGTIRVNLIMRRKKTLAAVVSFVEAAIFIMIIVRVVSEIDNIYAIIAYAAGFAVGTVLGIIISEKFSRDLTSTNIIVKNKNNEMKKMLVKEGYGVTCYKGSGKGEEDIEIINVISRQADLPKLNRLIYKKDPSAFVVSYLLDKIRGGFIRGLKKK